MAEHKGLKNHIIDLLRSGISSADIARVLGCSAATVCYHKKQAGYPIQRSESYDDITLHKIQQFYDLGNSLVDTCKKFQIAKSTLTKYKDRGLFKTRNFSEAGVVSSKKYPYVTSEETKQKQSKSRIEFLRKNPEKHPQRILSYNRKNWTYPEKIFAAALDELDIRYTHNTRILSFYPDFLFEDSKLIVEIDGEYYHKDKDRDAKRQRKLEDIGYKVVRFPAKQICKNLQTCVTYAVSFLIDR